MLHSLGSSWTGLLPAFSQAKFAVRWAGGEAAAAAYPGELGFSGSWARREQKCKGGHVLPPPLPDTRLGGAHKTAHGWPWGSQRLALSLSPAASFTLHAGSAQDHFLSVLSWDSDVLCPDLFAVRPLRPSRQCPCQQKLQHRACGPFSALRDLPARRPVLPSEGRQFVPRTLGRLSHLCVLAPPFSTGKYETCAQRRVPSAASPSARRGARDRCPHTPPASSTTPAPQPGLGPSLPWAARSSRQPRSRLRSARRFPAGPDPAEHAQCASWNPALPRPGSVFRVFAVAEGAQRRGGWETVSALFCAPSLASGSGRPRRKMRANQGQGAGIRPSRPPSGLIESYIKKFSSERGERGEGEGERGRREAREGEREQDGKERPRVSEAGKRAGIFLAPVTPESSRRVTITPTLMFPSRS